MATFLADAWNEQRDYDERCGQRFQRDVISKATRVLGLGDRAFAPWKRNHNADLYLARDARLVLKILVSKPAETLITEFRFLEMLHAISMDTGRFTVPRPTLLLGDSSAYVAEWLGGATGVYRMLAGSAGRAVGEAVGRALAAIHTPFFAAAESHTADELLTDCGHLPWRLKESERRTFYRVTEFLEGIRFPHAQVYGDFDPVNVLIRGRMPSLLDPPERDLSAPWHWDLATYYLGAHRVVWRAPALAFRRRAIDEHFSGLMESYTSRIGHNWGQADEVLTRLLALVRLGQLWVWWSHPTWYRQKLRGFVRATYAAPLVAAARRRLFRRLDAAIPR